MEMLWSLYVLVFLFSVPAAHSHRDPQGLSCVNDFVNNISCTWNGSAVGPGVDCWIIGQKKIWILKDNDRIPHLITRNCTLKHYKDSLPGCSFVFENKTFNSYEFIKLSMKCNGLLVANLPKYYPSKHIKMHPPGVPNISSTDNETLITWSPGSPVSIYITSFDFQVQIKQFHQTWEEAKILKTQDQKQKIPSSQLKGTSQVRVRVRPVRRNNSHWSNWSPVATATITESHNQESWLMQMSMFSLALVIIVVGVTVARKCMSRRLLARKPVPNPSKYFHTLHSVHGGNLKKWLNPVSESFFTVQPCDKISPVEVCKSWDVVHSTFLCSSSTSPLLHFRSYPSAGSDTSGVVDNSSSSVSSCFSNMGYFMSSSSSSSARDDHCPGYFIHNKDFRDLQNSHNLQLSLCPSFTASAYETLKREEPQSPDSGFGIGKENEEDEEDKSDVAEDRSPDDDDHQSTPLVILPVYLFSQMIPASTAPPAFHPPSLTPLISSDSQQEDVTVASASGSCAGWPVASPMYRSSSVPVETSKTGYLTLKELQTTFSNKSI
ncbi:hypothetical protein PAMA_009224 [Pampus argenteus]